MPLFFNSASARRVCWCVLSIGFSLGLAHSLRADVYQAQEDADLFGTTDQNTPGINNGGQACGPTSVYNSFVYLENEFGVDLSQPAGGGNSSAVNTINDLETYMGAPVQNDNDLVTGKEQYIDDIGESDRVVVESLVDDPNAIPADEAAEFIADQIAAGQDVEVGFFWSDKSGNATSDGHWITVTGIDYDTAGNGSINFIDPWGGVAISGNLYLGTNDQLVLGYSGGAAGNPADPDNPDDSGYGFITGIAAESVVPEPGIIWGLMAMVAGWALHRKAQRKAG